MALSPTTINVSIGIMTTLVLLLSIANVLTGFRNQCINGDPDYMAKDKSACVKGTCPTEEDAPGPNPVRTARDLQKFNMMTAFATGALAIGILYMVLWKGKGQEGTKNYAGHCHGDRVGRPVEASPWARSPSTTIARKPTSTSCSRTRRGALSVRRSVGRRSLAASYLPS